MRSSRLAADGASWRAGAAVSVVPAGLAAGRSARRLRPRPEAAGASLVSRPAALAPSVSRRGAAGRSDAPCSPVRARMTSTRSPLRILDVPLTPSCEARACSSGRRSVESAPVRAFPPAAAEPVALLVAVSMVSVTKDPSPSFAPAAQRAGRGWSTPGRDGRCAGVATRQWYDDVI
ncbi:MAG: hypothetical protein K0S43_2347 [Cellulosimicrobium sp.]|nr:hypothetical protein [Cellulosimicrobium sp.]